MFTPFREEVPNRILQSPVSPYAKRIEPYPDLEKMPGLDYKVNILSSALAFFIFWIIYSNTFLRAYMRE